MKKYDIYWASYLKEESKFKNKSDLTEDDFTIRPVLILDNDIIVKIAKITSHAPRKDTKEYLIKDWKSAGLRNESTIRFSKKDIISPQLLIKYIGHLAEEDIKVIESAHLDESIDNNALQEMKAEDLDKAIKEMYEYTKEHMGGTFDPHTLKPLDLSQMSKKYIVPVNTEVSNFNSDLPNYEVFKQAVLKQRKAALNTGSKIVYVGTWIQNDHKDSSVDVSKLFKSKYLAFKNTPSYEKKILYINEKGDFVELDNPNYIPSKEVKESVLQEKVVVELPDGRLSYRGKVMTVEEFYNMVFEVLDNIPVKELTPEDVKDWVY